MIFGLMCEEAGADIRLIGSGVSLNSKKKFLIYLLIQLKVYLILTVNCLKKKKRKSQITPYQDKCGG